MAQGMFRSVSRHDLEDVYDETCDVLRDRAPHESELHLRNALRLGIRRRALNVIRDRNTRERIIDEAAPAVYAEAQHQASSDEPERILLAQEDEFFIGEFISELTPQEREVFVLISDGQSYRAIATTLSIDEKEARNLKRACEKKRERFVTLFETGRLCGYRSHTINGVLSGKETSEAAWRQAVAHLRHCRNCQGEHRVSGKELQARFDRGALALLPPASLTAHTGLLERIATFLHKPVRLFDRATPGNGAIRERAVESLAGGAAAAKAAIAVGVIAVTGAAIEVHHAVDASRPPDRGSATVSRKASSGQLVSSLIGGRSSLGDWRETADDPRSGRGRELTQGESPGHLLRDNTAGPGHIVEHTAGPGHLLGSTRAPGGRERPPPTSVPLKPVESRAASSASAGTSPSPPLTPARAPKGPGRVLAP